MARYTIQQVEVRIKSTAEPEFYDIMVEDQYVGQYNVDTNFLYLESVGARETLAGAVMGALSKEFKRGIPNVSYES